MVDKLRSIIKKYQKQLPEEFVSEIQDYIFNEEKKQNYSIIERAKICCSCDKEKALKDFKISERTLRRYRRLMRCDMEILNAVERRIIPANAAIELSELDNTFQRLLIEESIQKGIYINFRSARKIKNAYRKHCVSEKNISKYLNVN